MGVAAISKAPELALDKEESRRLAEAGARVAAHYDLGASQKALDWGALFSVCAALYGPRFMAVYLRARMAAAKEVNPQPNAGANGPAGQPSKKPANDPNIVEIPGVGSVRVN